MRLLILLVPLALVGCGMFDRATGVDDPEGTPSRVEAFGEAIEKTLPAPWGHLAAVIVATAGTAYVGKRRRDKAKGAA